MEVATRNRLIFASAALTCVLLMSSVPGELGAAPAETFAVTDRGGPGERFPAKPTRPAPSKRIEDDDGGPLAGTSPVVVPQVVLEPLSLASLLREDDLAARGSSLKVLRAGVGRGVEMDAASGNWYDMPTGRLWLAEIVSPEALGLRVEFSQLRLPKNAELAVTRPGAVGLEQVEFVEPDARLRGVHYAPLVFGERVRIEYFVPNGSFVPSVYELPFRVASVQHFYRDPLSGDVTNLRAAGNCHNDVTCFASWAGVAKAVSRITFVKNGSSYLCTGQLINAQNSDLTPYWLTANHCVATQTVAATVQFFWRYQTASCGGSPPSLASVPSSTGATLLATGTASDYSLLMVEGGLPAGLTWVGWTSANVADGVASTSIHHPSGDYKRISFGNKASNTSCGGASHVRINWTDGPTEGGSSGGGIFRNDTQQLYGQLHCGGSACGNETNDDYGAFSATYPNISGLLAGGSDDASEQNDTCATARTVSAGTLSNRIVKSTDLDWYKISVPAGKTLTVNLAFTHANGDIDTAMYTTCGGSAVATSAGSGNSETMTVTNSGTTARTYYFQAYLFADTRNAYSLTTSIP